VLVVCYSSTEEQLCLKCVILKQRSSSAGVCYSNTEEQQRRKCVILIQRSSSAESVLFLYREAAVLKVCYSNTELQHYC